MKDAQRRRPMARLSELEYNGQAIRPHWCTSARRNKSAAALTANAAYIRTLKDAQSHERRDKSRPLGFLAHEKNAY